MPCPSCDTRGTDDNGKICRTCNGAGFVWESTSHVADVLESIAAAIEWTERTWRHTRLRARYARICIGQFVGHYHRR